MRGSTFIGLASLAALVGCSGEPCENSPAAVSAEVRFGTDIRDRVRTVDATLIVGDDRFQRTFDVGASPDDPMTFAVVLDEAPKVAGFELKLEVRAIDADQAVVAEGSARADGTTDACNELVVTLGTIDDTDAGVVDDTDAGNATDGGPPPSDAGSRDAGTPDAGPQPFGVVPTDHRAPWVDEGTELSFVSNITFAGAATDLTATTTTAELVAQVEAGTNGTHTLRLTWPTGTLALGPSDATVTVNAPGEDPIVVRLYTRIFRTVHVGVTASGCPHDDPTGTRVTACNYVGANAILTAATEATPYTHVILYDDDGAPAYYGSAKEGIQLGGTTWIGGAAGVDPENIMIRCRFGRALRLMGDGVRVENFSIISSGGCDHLVSTWDDDIPQDGTGGHEIDRMVFAALMPEVFGVNSTQEAIGLSENTTLTNSWLYGYWESFGTLSFAHGSSLVGNTFVAYQTAEAGMDISGARDLTVANNVIIALGGSSGSVFAGDVQTTGLTVVGNVHQGFLPPIISGLDPVDMTNRLEDNSDDTTGIEYPHRPQFFADSTPSVSALVPSVKMSFDGVDVDGVTPDVPGAFQLRSPRMGPRRSVVRLGQAGCTTCDFTTDVENEVQVAAWSVWPAGVLEIDPGTYAGNVVVSWPIEIRGVNGAASAIILRSSDESMVFWRHGMWESHRAVLAVTRDAFSDATFENFTLVADGVHQTAYVGAFLEGAFIGANADTFALRNVIVDTRNELSVGFFQALVTGHRVLVQDVLSLGDWEMCARVAGNNPRPTTFTSVTATFVNYTCRLQGTGIHSAVSGFDVASVESTRFINTILSNESPGSAAALFRAQRRRVGDEGTLARDPPRSFGTYAVHYIGFEELYDGFTMTSGMYDILGLTELVTRPLFVSPTDSHLRAGTDPIDSGVDPATIDVTLSAGVGLDGQSRVGQSIDRGAYEQGD